MTERRWLAVASIRVVIKTPNGGEMTICYTGDHSSTEGIEAIRGAVERAAEKAMSADGLLERVEREVKTS